MELTKGQRGRRFCGVIQVIFGVFLASSAISNALRGHIDVMRFLFAAFLIITGLLGAAGGAAGATRERIIAYLVCGIICSLIFIFSTIFYILATVGYNNENPDDTGGLVLLIVTTVIAAFSAIVAVTGVICAILPWCGQ